MSVYVLYVCFCWVGSDGWVVSVITRLQLLIDIITTGQLRAAARPQRERGELGSLNQWWIKKVANDWAWKKLDGPEFLFRLDMFKMIWGDKTGGPVGNFKMPSTHVRILYRHINEQVAVFLSTYLANI